MIIPAEAYEVEESEFFEDFETTDEARRGFRPARRVFVPGGGLTSATLNTPKGPARLNLPAALPTLAQFRALETVVNAQSQRMNAVQAELVRVRRELVIRRREQQGQGSSSLLFPLLLQKKLRDDLEGHTHATATGPAVLPAGTSGGFSSFLPLLLLSPGLFGGSSASSAAGGGQESMISPLLMALVFLDL
jgi:hypothetical protein